jgi:hypothetical protein
MTVGRFPHGLQAKSTAGATARLDAEGNAATPAGRQGKPARKLWDLYCPATRSAAERSVSY